MGSLSDKHGYQIRCSGNSGGGGDNAGCPCVRRTKRQFRLPIGGTAKITFEIDAMRAVCCRAAGAIAEGNPIQEWDLEECARLDDALAHAQRILKSAVRDVMLGRLSRRAKH